MKNVLKLIAVFGVCTIPPIAAAQNSAETEVVARMVQSTLKSYNLMVVQKLERDGAGSAVDFSSKKGFVPTPEAFIRRVAFNTIAKNKRSREKQFTFTFAPGGKGLLSVKINDNALSKDKKALVVAKILDSMVRSIRGTYTAVVVHKLRKDGAGASLKYAAQTGFVPLPAVFVRTIFSDIMSKQISSDAQQLSLGLRSRWNLNKQQGLQDDFERQGWEFLSNQQATRLALGQPLKKYNWDPYVKMATVGEKPVLRFLSADPAAGRSCVACHNQWENKEEIKLFRTKQDVEVAKAFKMHELMGALSITVAMEQ